MVKTFPIRDFSGGLNLRDEEGSLKPNETSSVSNFTMLDSKALIRRSGSYAVTGTPVSTSAVKGFWRYYQADGDAFWFMVCGTAAYKRQDTAYDTPWTTVQAEARSATATTTVAGALFSGGKACYYTSVATFTLPYSNYMKLNLSCVTGSFKLDAGAWASITATTNGADYMALHTPAVMTATTHTFAVKAPPRNDTAMHFTIAAGNTYYRYKDITAAVNATTTSYGCTERLSFYDNGTSPYTALFRIYPRAGGSGYLELGLRRLSSTSYYGLYDSKTATFYASTVARSAGWHHLEARVGKTFSGGLDGADDAYVSLIAQCKIDGVAVGGARYLMAESASTDAAYRVMAYGKNHGSSGNTNIYFDGHYQDYRLVDDFAAVTAWSQGGTGSADPSSTTKDTTPHLWVDTIQYASEGSWVKVNATVSASTDIVSAAILKNALYFGSAYDSLRKYSGSTTTASVPVVTGSSVLSSPAAYLVEHKGRLFAAGKSTNTSIVEHSALRDPDDWATTGDDGAGWFYPNANDAGTGTQGTLDAGEGIVGLTSWEGKLWTHTQARVYYSTVDGAPSAWSTKVIDGPYGCVAPRSIAAGPNAIVWMGSDTIWAFGYITGINSTDGSGIVNIGRNIQPVIAALTAAQKASACGIVYRDQYWIQLGSDVYVYRFPEPGRTGSWTKYTYPYTFSCFQVPRADEGGLYAGSDSDGTIYRLDSGDTDDGNAITSSYRLPPMAIQGYETVKTFPMMYVTAEAGDEQTLTVTPFTDMSDGISQDVTIGSESGVRPARVPISARGRSIGCTFSTDGSEQPLTLDAVTIAYSTPRRR